MNSQISERFKIFYIREFTKELVKNSKSTYFLELEALIKERSIKKEESERLKREKIREIVKEKFKKEEKEIREIRPGTMREPLQIIKAKPRLAPRVLTIPQPRLPERFQYLQPSPIEIEMDIGKLNALARDPAVSVIDCPGKGEKIRVMIRNNIKPTGITLAEEEINQIIDNTNRIILTRNTQSKKSYFIKHSGQFSPPQSTLVSSRHPAAYRHRP